jgi:hypothetical protein
VFAGPKTTIHGAATKTIPRARNVLGARNIPQFMPTAVNNKTHGVIKP